MSIAEMFLELLLTINTIVNEETRQALKKTVQALIKENAVSVTKDLFNPNRRHLAFIDGSVLTRHKGRYRLSQPTNERKNHD